MALTKEYFMEATASSPVIPAIKNEEWLENCKSAECGIVYIIYGGICTIGDIVDSVKAMGKMAVVHVDLIVGLSSKEISIDFIKKYTKADGIISMKPALIKRANELGMFTIQRFYMMDALTYANIVKHVKSCNPDVVEFLPAGLPKVIKYLLAEIDKPVVASGLILDKEDVMGALKAGAFAVSTTNRQMWDC
jgi:glycerol uptake operon antiterminator